MEEGEEELVKVSEPEGEGDCFQFLCMVTILSSRGAEEGYLKVGEGVQTVAFGCIMWNA